MREKSVKEKRSESLLKEALSEALATLSDPRLNSLSVIDVDCSRGKHDATVYLDPTGIERAEQKEIKKQLRVARGAISEYCLTSTEWFKCPKFTFEFDDSIQTANRLDALFEQIKKERGE